MSVSRRKWITAGIGAAAGVTGLGVASRLLDRYGLLPPDHGGLYGPGHTLTYAAHRLLTRNSLAREFSRDQISKNPFANATALKSGEFDRLRAGGFADWKVVVEGMVQRPLSISLPELKSLPSRSQITSLTCEEGWSFIAEWTGVPLAEVLERAGMLPKAKYVVYSSMDGWVDGLDMADAMHPQTLLTYGMNGAALPVGHGGPLRMRVPRQLGYKSMKYVNRLKVADSLKEHLQSGDYSWYAGI